MTPRYITLQELPRARARAASFGSILGSTRSMESWTKPGPFARFAPKIMPTQVKFVFFKQVEAQPNEEATGSSSTPFSQSGQNKDDDWLGDVFIVKEEKANPDDKLDSEIETFCNTTNITREEDSLKWWAERESLFPCLSWVAKKYLAIPASSVPSEWIFSLAGNIVSKKRACLKPEMLTCWYFWKKVNK